MILALSRLRARRDAYRRLFLDGDGRLRPDAVAVFADLKRFCRVDRSTLVVSPITRVVDTHATMLAEGRREVWMRLQAHLKLDDRQIADLNDGDNE